MFDTIGLYLSSKKVLARRARLGRRSAVDDVGEWATPDALVPTLASVLEASSHGSRALEVYVGAAFVTLLTVPVPRGLKSDGERTTVASALVKDRLGFAKDEWAAMMCIARDDQPNAVIQAIRRDHLEAIASTATRYRLRLKGVKPFAVHGLNRLLFEKRFPEERGEELSVEEGRSKAALLVVEEDALSTFVVSRDGYDLVSSVSQMRSIDVIGRETMRLEAGLGVTNRRILTLSMVCRPDGGHGPIEQAVAPFGSERRIDYLDCLQRSQ